MATENISIRERLGNGAPSGGLVNGNGHGNGLLAGQRPGGIDNRAYQDLKQHIHQTLLDRVDLESMQRLSPTQLRDELRLLVERLLEEEVVVINDTERKNLTRDIQNEMLGFGPLEMLLADPSVSDILVNTYNQVYVERRGKLELTDVTFNEIGRAHV